MTKELPARTKVILNYRYTQSGIITKRLSDTMVEVKLDGGNTVEAECMLQCSPKRMELQPVVEVALKGAEDKGSLCYIRNTVVDMGQNLLSQPLFGSPAKRRSLELLVTLRVI